MVSGLTPWGKALERLRGHRSYRSMETSGIIPIKQYKNMLRSKFGPSVFILDRWLKGMGYKWRDWAEVFERESERALHAAEHSPPYGRRRPTRPGTQKSPQSPGHKKAAGS